MNTIKDQAIILKTKKYQDADLIVTFFSENQGKITGLAKGVRKAKSRWQGRFTPFSLVDLELVNKPNISLRKIIKLEVSKSSDLIEKDNFYLSSFIAEVAIKLNEEGHKFEQLFDLLSELAAILGENRFEQTKLKNIISIYLVKILTIMGLLSSFYFCSKCHKKFSKDKPVYWKESGELFCENCTDRSYNLSFNELKVLSFWQRAKVKDALVVDLDQITSSKILNSLLKELNVHFSSPLKSWDILMETSLLDN